MDKINIKNLEIFANHGVYPEENRLGQKFIVTASLYTQFSEAAQEEDLSKSIHYGEAAKAITSFMQANTFQLIETAAEKLAEHLLCTIPNLKGVDIEVKKPWAPVKFSMETVSASLHREWHKVFLSIGSNMGDRETYLERASEALKAVKTIRLNKVSPVYETPAYGGVEQSDYLNACLEIDTVLEPYMLLKLIHKIEADNHRERIIHWGPRTLDIDILLYDDLILHEEQLSIPHVDMENRRFVLEPLKDIAPYAYNPVTGKTAGQMFAALVEKER